MLCIIFDLARETCLRPTAGRIRRRGSSFNTGAAFLIYAIRPSKACQIIDIDSSWRNDGVGAAIKGSTHAHVPDNKFDNFILMGIFVSLIRIEWIDKPFAKMRRLEFISALRSISESSPARMDTTSGEMSAKSKPSSKSILGICDVMGINRLVLMLAKKNIADCRY